MSSANTIRPTTPQYMNVDLESQRPEATPAPVATASSRSSSRGKKAAILTTIGVATAGAVGAGIYFATKPHSHAPATVPPAPAPAPQAVQPAIVPPPAPVPQPKVSGNNITGFSGVSPFTMAKNTAMYVGLPFTGGTKYAIVLSDANETCQSLSAAPVRSNGIQEIDLCQASNSTSITAQNGRSIINGQQWTSTAMGLNGTLGADGVLQGQFHMNTTNDGFMQGNFTATNCATLKFTDFCDLQN